MTNYSISIIAGECKGGWLFDLLRKLMYWLATCKLIIRQL